LKKFTRTRSCGFRTDHSGVGRCYLHGGCTPVKHGLYADPEVHARRLRALISKHAANPKPLDLLPELAQLRTFVEDLFDRWDSIYGPDGALLAWHESHPEGERASKPRQIPDLSAVAGIIDKVGAMADRIIKHRTNVVMTADVLRRLLDHYGAELAAALTEDGYDALTILAIAERLEARIKDSGLLPAMSGGT
jgi:hypothetical protein